MVNSLYNPLTVDIPCDLNLNHAVGRLVFKLWKQLHKYPGCVPSISLFEVNTLAAVSGFNGFPFLLSEVSSLTHFFCGEMIEETQRKEAIFFNIYKMNQVPMLGQRRIAGRGRNVLS